MIGEDRKALVWIVAFIAALLFLLALMYRPGW